MWRINIKVRVTSILSNVWMSNLTWLMFVTFCMFSIQMWLFKEKFKRFTELQYAHSCFPNSLWNLVTLCNCGHAHQPQMRMVEMKHFQTPATVKGHILDQFSDVHGHLRVLLATIAYCMGVNCKGVSKVIHFGPSKSIEAYVQEVTDVDAMEKQVLLFFCIMVSQ